MSTWWVPPGLDFFQKSALEDLPFAESPENDEFDYPWFPAQSWDSRISEAHSVRSFAYRSRFIKFSTKHSTVFISLLNTGPIY
ncbi:hypothetical protein N7447_006016 [Penicillium robsamsonii]|uniref:uncharacterized protein n=1 Tax=Penicillium robsamsonii TaxID=1792511 RepID=UPI0025478218|nr:uncharacterized protein N7447_006016 [Penicillium robsamsonii]KAJ5823676.1 hypothetical protein N7447_006016 [Penicillium robsamsonii]